MSDHHDTIHAIAAQFHRNFSNGAFEVNGGLVTDDIEVNSNAFVFSGRDAFVERLRRYEASFPGLQLRDQVIVVDGRSAAVQYVLQGRHDGPYGEIEPTGRLIEIHSGEVFDFDEHGKMERLLTITRLDRIPSQLVGPDVIQQHQEIDLKHPSGPATLRIDTHELYASLAAGEFGMLREMSDEQVKTSVRTHEDPDRLEAFIGLWKNRSTAFPAAVVTVDRTLRDGAWTAVSYTLTGTHSGPLRDPEGRVHEATGMPVMLRGIDFLRTDDGKLVEIIAIHNGDDAAVQIAPGEH
ncbi:MULTISPECIES: ester cyclase [unclassified Microbacterium]|uniref:ester cyclase n=1 Tax=unclassified Microbacterium TaxID=2609290 RepID=UPI0012F754F4|nr:ester cyclase [Microbacterium sp. MAH-37]MVQ41360.1 hypothetical protein [Microbacterium sp. MAH-37]